MNFFLLIPHILIKYLKILLFLKKRKIFLILKSFKKTIQFYKILLINYLLLFSIEFLKSLIIK